MKSERWGLVAVVAVIALLVGWQIWSSRIAADTGQQEQGVCTQAQQWNC